MIPKQTVNMTDVARRSGVSIASVSRALRGESGVSAATRDRILSAARELAYVVSPEASRLSGGPTGRVGVIVPRVDAWFYSTILAGIADEFDTVGMDLILCTLPTSAARHRFFEALPLRRKVDAAVVVSLPLSARERTRLDQLAVPTVFVGGHRTEDHRPWVGIDDERAAQQAVGHLLRIGHHDIAMIQAADDTDIPWATDQARIRGFHQTMQEAGLADPTVVTVKWSVDGGSHGMETLLSRSRPPTAVFCHSDEIALGALRTLRRSGISVPQQVSVIGVDDHPAAELSDLTTVAQPVREQGRIAARVVLGGLGDGDASGPPASVTTLPTRLVVRGSTAPPR
ncbi:MULTISPECIES: LacI family DNA-binding transcriptional regulator [Mycolicibacterium]|jgi:DNA-binding LacI/PurR family transcriptional regulator|uniref:Transcriptional regulator, LacI family n=2 Tax=Mycolicibacterium TaxID=1866885 RepID=A1T856_MYCVP|nr:MULTISPECIES: LacI family DNA-binding transcriptional regulator [Mycolicibacterium]ABM13356.1 transcriptional regulator, LacI family [Mycolicibacterium vanbaalenii PYR-1]MCV7126804.1 LacI family DNA-binding transcriptional regulator [Mycolicibacterium vanbaalenii PYR-1]MDN4517835.1 LacI family DNA-binding transcriptional regulator [Mycolicibacterium austroafricanum]MDW5613711.1 LacI family DNA-binding transcriptional regulator [Mycolicibacterium sp. D5.8-2]PQP41806.1 LacI family transcripti